MKEWQDVQTSLAKADESYKSAIELFDSLSSPPASFPRKKDNKTGKHSKASAPSATAAPAHTGAAATAQSSATEAVSAESSLGAQLPGQVATDPAIAKIENHAYMNKIYVRLNRVRIEKMRFQLLLLIERCNFDPRFCHKSKPDAEYPNETAFQDRPFRITRAEFLERHDNSRREVFFFSSLQIS